MIYGLALIEMLSGVVLVVPSASHWSSDSVVVGSSESITEQ